MHAIIIMGSESDRKHADSIVSAMEGSGIAVQVHVASAHKQPLEVLDILKRYSKERQVVYITIAGRSNALSGFVAANCTFPVIACPPFADKIDMLVNIHSTLQMPSQVPVLTILDPANAALAVQRIFGMCNPQEFQPCAE
ncbi:MAG: AIR carboxylase family protein [Sphaerochaetaceae bacterium]